MIYIIWAECNMSFRNHAAKVAENQKREELIKQPNNFGDSSCNIDDASGHHLARGESACIGSKQVWTDEGAMVRALKIHNH